ncbi:cupin domain-containing protein [Massilioclostridium coli]|uniref:cupin domain-containing protein n=1 Tax=Massilioclostridium coli TaxID=1870991 RepID=UPI00085CDCD4|nr:cupin domain-containing protein [Massilioclostridium coli]
MNLFASPKEILPQEQVEELVCSKSVRIEKIVSQGHCSPSGFWYDQTEDEWVSVLQGNAVIQFEDHEICLQPGDSLLIPAHQKHRVAETSVEPNCIWLCVFGNLTK